MVYYNTPFLYFFSSGHGWGGMGSIISILHYFYYHFRSANYFFFPSVWEFSIQLVDFLLKYISSWLLWYVFFFFRSGPSEQISVEQVRLNYFTERKFTFQADILPKPTVNSIEKLSATVLIKSSVMSEEIWKDRNLRRFRVTKGWQNSSET